MEILLYEWIEFLPSVPHDMDPIRSAAQKRERVREPQSERERERQRERERERA